MRQVALRDAVVEAQRLVEADRPLVEVARMLEVGRKLDRWLDLVLLQRIIDP